MSVAVGRVKCACSDCVCIGDVDKGVNRDGRICCGEARADHHKNGAGCQHATCTCHG